MHLSTLIPAILALATPSLSAVLSPRAASCSLKSTTTSIAALPLATLDGPFLIKSKTTQAEYNNRYAAITVRLIPLPKSTTKEQGLVISFDQEPKSAAQEFYLMGNELVYLHNDTITAAYEPATGVTRKTAYVLVGPAPEAGVTNVACTLDKSTCELVCTAGDYKYNCLANPGDQPDWRIVESKAGAGPATIPFAPYVVAK